NAAAQIAGRGLAERSISFPNSLLETWHGPSSPCPFVSDMQIDAPVFVADGRFGIQLRGPGGVVDSPEGLRLRTELIIGIGNRGPAQRLNQFTLEVVRDQFPGLSDQVTRHHIEEVGNFADFLPELFAQYGPGSRLTRLAALG
ncbi:hypothetical protein HaLaN_24547, partial [Haematococcus lacustris]